MKKILRAGQILECVAKQHRILPGILQDEIKLLCQGLDSLSRQIGIKGAILFGSRSTGRFKAFSDWDVLLVLKDKETKEVREQVAEWQASLLLDFGLDVQVIIKGYEEVVPWPLSEEILKEGGILYVAED